MADILDILFYASLVASVLSMLLSYVVWQRRPAAGASVFSLMMIATAVWTGAYAIEISSSAYNTKMFWSRISHIGVILVPVLWFSFANKYSKIKIFDKKYIESKIDKISENLEKNIGCTVSLLFTPQEYEDKDGNKRMANQIYKKYDHDVVKPSSYIGQLPAGKNETKKDNR